MLTFLKQNGRILKTLKKRQAFKLYWYHFDTFMSKPSLRYHYPPDWHCSLQNTYTLVILVDF